MRPLDDVFDRLARSAFRQGFMLSTADRAYLRAKGLPTVLAHARDFVAKRLAPAVPDRDGKQTPFRVHPAFVAQHATATCCRSCLAKWHRIPTGLPLSNAEQDHVVRAIARWLASQHLPGETALKRDRRERDRHQPSLPLFPSDHEP